MRPTRVRFTMRRLMVAVAVVGLILAGMPEIPRRKARFQRLAKYHLSEFADVCFDMKVTNDGQETYFIKGHEPVSIALQKWHEALQNKYRRAADRPWLPVAPDPPEPK